MVLKDQLELVYVFIFCDEEEDVLMFEVQLLINGQLPVVGKFILPLEDLHQSLGDMARPFVPTIVWFNFSLSLSLSLSLSY